MIAIKKNIFITIVLLLFSICIFSQSFNVVNKLAGINVSENNGVAVADYDGDLDLDVFVVAIALDDANSQKTLSRLYRNNNDGTFTNVTNASGLFNLLPELGDLKEMEGLAGFKYGAFWGDYDNDGYPDIFFTHIGKVQLFHNQGDGTFTDVTTQAGIQKDNGCGNTGATWFDYNNDGFLDLYINDWGQCGYNTLYKNNRDGTFTKTTEDTGILRNANHAYTALPFDFNKDGWMDLYVTNDFSDPNSLFINNQGNSFIDEAQAYGLDSKRDDMGIAFGDYNNDGAFDIYITTIDENPLLTYTGNSSYNDKATELRVKNTGWAWGTKFADFDLDADLDLIVANGFNFVNRGTERNVYYKNENQKFEDITEFVELSDKTISVEALDFDYDNDGDLDLFITNSDRESFFYENNLINTSDQSSDLNWFKVMLQGTVSNRDAIGTVLTLTTNNRIIKRYHSGVGFLGQSLKPVHFGLKNDAEILELKIEWPSGIVETHNNLTVDTTIRATENNGYQILNVEPSLKLRGCTDPNSCTYNPNAVVDDGSCRYLLSGDINGSTSSTYFKTEQYSYPLASATTINWEVTGGEIVSRNNNSITVKWGFENEGKITVKVSNTICQSEDRMLDVELGIPDKNELSVSVVRLWNEALLNAIRGDYARPTVHARNLFHISAAMYDAWAIHHKNKVKPYLMGNNVHGFSSSLSDFEFEKTKLDESLNKAISYAAYRLLLHRFKDSPGAKKTLAKFNILMNQLGYDINDTSVNYKKGNAAALGNYIAQTYIKYGLQDGSREQTKYDNAYYKVTNKALAPTLPGNETITDPNRWQSLSLDTYIDQSGNLIEGTSIDFLSPEWGNVHPFAMTDGDKATHAREGENYNVYHDPSAPPYIDTSNQESDEAYKWGFSLVSVWSAHLDPYDGTLWDISPKSIGNINIDNIPTSYTDYSKFYKLLKGGDTSQGRATNPIIGKPYEAQMVPRGDYARVLAEFWADGPDSETPPGHWFTILNYVSDHPSLVKKFEGKGDVLSDLEWDVKTYFTLGGTMHDAAISAWSVKGWYDYIRPISAIRYMANKGQSTDNTLSNYNKNGIPLIKNYIEVVKAGDPLAGRANENVNKIKLFAWKGHSFINNTNTDEAGVGWILAENWWPYQRPSFVTPPFAGYVSGHSTYSRAAAEVMTLMTGSEYFPDGMGEFVAKKNKFLVFEQGPSMDVKLQWATYRDASDQCSLSRIWGGIHPPADDIPGRFIGKTVGIKAFTIASNYFKGIADESSKLMFVYPNPLKSSRELTITNTTNTTQFYLYDLVGNNIKIKQNFKAENNTTIIKTSNVSKGMYILKTHKDNWKILVL